MILKAFYNLNYSVILTNLDFLVLLVCKIFVTILFSFSLDFLLDFSYCFAALTFPSSFLLLVLAQSFFSSYKTQSSHSFQNLW